MNVVDSNRQRDLYLTDGDNVWFIPQGWCDDFSIANGSSGGLDYVDDFGEVRPEIYCYAPLGLDKNSEVDTLYCSIASLEVLRETTEEESRQIHPELFRYLDAINSEA